MQLSPRHHSTSAVPEPPQPLSLSHKPTHPHIHTAANATPHPHRNTTNSSSTRKMSSAAVTAFKQGLLRHIRVPLQQQSLFGSSGVLAAGTSLSLWRGFAGGGYLDKDNVTQRVLDVTKHFEKIDPAKVQPGAHFEKDLGLDSLDVVELVMAFEEEFQVEIPDADADKIFSVDDAVNYIASHPMAK